LDSLASTAPYLCPVFAEVSPHCPQGCGEFLRVLTPYRLVLLTMIKIGLIAAISFGPGNQ
jgi:hypothetical protein